MTSFVVLSHDDEPASKTGEKTVFVRDALFWTAFAFPVLWLLWHRLWFASAIAICVFATLLWAVQNPSWIGPALLLNFAVAILVATEGPVWRITKCQLFGYKPQGVVEADCVEDAQIIWASRISGDRALAKPATIPSARMSAHADDDLIFGGSS